MSDKEPLLVVTAVEAESLSRTLAAVLGIGWAVRPTRPFVFSSLYTVQAQTICKQITITITADGSFTADVVGADKPINGARLQDVTELARKQLQLQARSKLDELCASLRAKAEVDG